MRPRVTRAAVSLLILAGGTGVAYSLAGARVALAVAVALLLVTVARHDDRTGTCLPLAVLLLVILGVILLLFYLILVTHPR